MLQTRVPMAAGDATAGALGRGISFGGALDVDDEDAGDWLDERHFDVVRDAGFDTIRLPVKWSAHMATSPPYAVDAAFFDRVDRAVECGLRRDLNVVLDVHHFDELCMDAARHAPRFLALWSQIAQRYADLSARLCFELLNEPHDPMAAQEWNDLLAAALAVVRTSNPERTVIAGPGLWNTVDGLPELRLPDDAHLIATIHYYSPFAFTHQGVDWLEGADRWLGTTWGTDADRARVRTDLARAAAWAHGHGRRLFLGEFGVHRTVVQASRAAWTTLVRTEAERLGVSWAYWDFATDFGAFDLGRHAWRAPLAQALVAAE
jgi:endoglucanase